MVLRRTKRFVKIAISSTSAFRNAQGVGDVLIAKYGSIEQIPPALVMYTGGGPKHRTFLCVKTAIITLQNFLILITYLEFEHK